MQPPPTSRVDLPGQKWAGPKGPRHELIQLYALEGFLDRLSGSIYMNQLVLQGGVMLAAFGERRPARDVDLAGVDLKQ